MEPQVTLNNGKQMQMIGRKKSKLLLDLYLLPRYYIIIKILYD